MERYVVNNQAQSNGDYEVHKEGCRYFPSNYTFLGYYYNCRDAVNAAKRFYSKSDGCIHCVPHCNNR